MQGGSIFALSPSFSSYSSTSFAEIAAKVSDEFQEQREELGLEDEVSSEKKVFIEEEQIQIPLLPSIEEKIESQDEKEEEEERGSDNDDEDDDDDDDDFEFAVLSRDPNASPISADEIFLNGQIKPIYPVFNRDLLFAGGQDDFTKLQDGSTFRLPLRKLLISERDPTSTSSSEADDFEALSDGTYCIWTPKPVQASPERCKKSNSTGSSSKRWRFRDLLHRSNSDGKDTFVFLTPTKKKPEIAKERRDSSEVSKQRRNSGDVSKQRRDSGEASASAHEVHYVRNRARNESDRKKSYLPYRQDLVGLFANVNGLNRTLRPF